jgi:hypothetical protein
MIDVSGRSRLICQPSSRTGENPPYGMIAGVLAAAIGVMQQRIGLALSAATPHSGRHCTSNKPSTRTHERGLQSHPFYFRLGRPIILLLILLPVGRLNLPDLLDWLLGRFHINQLYAPLGQFPAQGIIGWIFNCLSLRALRTSRHG